MELTIRQNPVADEVVLNGATHSRAHMPGHSKKMLRRKVVDVFADTFGFNQDPNGRSNKSRRKKGKRNA